MAGDSVDRIAICSTTSRISGRHTKADAPPLSARRNRIGVTDQVVQGSICKPNDLSSARFQTQGPAGARRCEGLSNVEPQLSPNKLEIAVVIGGVRDGVKLVAERQRWWSDSLWRVCMSKRPKLSIWRKCCKSRKLKSQQVMWNQWVVVERIPLPPPFLREGGSPTCQIPATKRPASFAETFRLKTAACACRHEPLTSQICSGLNTRYSKVILRTVCSASRAHGDVSYPFVD